MKRQRRSFSPFGLGNLSQMRHRAPRMRQDSSSGLLTSHFGKLYCYHTNDWRNGGVSATTETFCTQKSESASRPVTESVKHRQINALKATKTHASPFFVVTAQRSQQLWHCSCISRSQFASFIWDPLLDESARPITTEGF